MKRKTQRTREIRFCVRSCINAQQKVFRRKSLLFPPWKDSQGKHTTKVTLTLSPLLLYFRRMLLRSPGSGGRRRRKSPPPIWMEDFLYLGKSFPSLSLRYELAMLYLAVYSTKKVFYWWRWQIKNSSRYYTYKSYVKILAFEGRTWKSQSPLKRRKQNKWLYCIALNWN